MRTQFRVREMIGPRLTIHDTIKSLNQYGFVRWQEDGQSCGTALIVRFQEKEQIVRDLDQIMRDLYISRSRKDQRFQEKDQIVRDLSKDQMVHDLCI